MVPWKAVNEDGMENSISHLQIKVENQQFICCCPLFVYQIMS